MKEDTILKVLPWDVRSIIQKEKLEFEYLQEIRLREGKPLIFLYHDTEVIPGAKARRPYLVTKDNIREMLEYISNYSLYACEQEMRQGFITENRIFRKKCYSILHRLIPRNFSGV